MSQFLTLDRSSFYTVEKIGRSRELTPEGFLLLRDVPLARTGVMMYGAGELGDDLTADGGVIIVERNEDDLFRPETLASFEGKPVTNDHPDDVVNPENYREHMVGVVQNVHRGEGVLSDLMLGDLLIMDAKTIKDIEAGKVQVSNGYEADYEQLAPGRARQFNIIGNHVALVDQGRCGPRCAIGDSIMKTKDTAAVVKKVSIWDRIMAAVATGDQSVIAKTRDEVTEMEEGTSREERLPGEPNATHVHVHLTGGGSEKAATSDETEEETPPNPLGGGETKMKDEGEEAEALGAHESDDDKRFKALEAAVAQIAETVKRLAGEGGGAAAAETADGDGEESDEEDMTDVTEDEEIAEELKEVKNKDGKLAKDAATKDSAALAGVFRDVLSRAEIIAPGIKLPTFDAKLPPTATTKLLCGLRRRALVRAATSDEMRPLVRQVTEDADVSAMTCDQVRAAFNGVTAAKAHMNNIQAVAGPRLRAADTGAKKIGSIADLNKRNQEFYSRGRGATTH